MVVQGATTPVFSPAKAVPSQFRASRTMANSSLPFTSASTRAVLSPSRLPRARLPGTAGVKTTLHSSGLCHFPQISEEQALSETQDDYSIFSLFEDIDENWNLARSKRRLSRRFKCIMQNSFQENDDNENQERNLQIVQTIEYFLNIVFVSVYFVEKISLR